MTKFRDACTDLVGAQFTPRTVEKLVEAKLEDLKVLVSKHAAINSVDYEPFERKSDMAHSGSSMDGLGKILTELFPGVQLTDTRLETKAGDRDRLQLTLIGNMGILMNPESHMDPDILKILQAKRSAEEMRKDNGK